VTKKELSNLIYWWGVAVSFGVWIAFYAAQVEETFVWYDAILRLCRPGSLSHCSLVGGCLALERKGTQKEKVASWVRPKTMRKMTRKKFWTKEQDEYVLSHSVEESICYLTRSEKSVIMRLWRLKQQERNLL
jgi:hypothetical protein